jgi:hypothetical protein
MVIDGLSFGGNSWVINPNGKRLNQVRNGQQRYLLSAVGHGYVLATRCKCESFYLANDGKTCKFLIVKWKMRRKRHQSFEPWFVGSYQDPKLQEYNGNIPTGC